MKTDHFLMDNGAGYHTRLWRVWSGTKWVWRDAPVGDPAIELDDEKGRPVDVFGLPVNGSFCDAVYKKIY